MELWSFVGPAFNRGVSTDVSAMKGLPILELRDRSAWEAWLLANHQSSRGVWLEIAKKGSRRATVTKAEAVDEAVSFGWIDGQLGNQDQKFFRLRFTPRQPGSRWSAVNRERAQTLIAEGRMKPAGLREYKLAEADGRLHGAYPSQSRAVIPEDFQRALDEHVAAREFFRELRSADRYRFLYRLHNTRDPVRRAKRIANYVERLGQRRTLT